LDVLNAAAIVRLLASTIAIFAIINPLGCLKAAAVIAELFIRAWRWRVTVIGVTNG
jgi:hypothetical protein